MGLPVLPLFSHKIVTCVVQYNSSLSHIIPGLQYIYYIDVFYWFTFLFLILGIGPTHDDVTYEGVATAFDDKLILSQEIVKFWAYYTNDPGATKASTKKLSTIPKSSVILYPKVPSNVILKGKFPVVSINNVIIFPGVPLYTEILFKALEGTYFNSFGVVFYNKSIYLNASEQVNISDN